MDLTVSKTPGGNLVVYTNCVYLNPNDFAKLRQASPVDGAEHDKEVEAFGIAIHIGSFIFNAQSLAAMPAGQLGVNSLQRMTARLSLNQKIFVNPYAPVNGCNALASVSCELSLLQKAKDIPTIEIDCDRLATHALNSFRRQIFNPGQKLAIEFEGKTYQVVVSSMKVTTLGKATTNEHGQLLDSTDISFTKHKEAPIKLTGQGSSTGSKIFNTEFDFAKLGIGGLDEEFNQIFRRAFASRIFPTRTVQQMGLQHVRGMLLYGPPGCGKTLIARQIGKVLNAREPKIVNGPECLNKFVGQTEENIRNLFVDAEEEQKEVGDDSELHIIIFDEIDAICKSRGSTRDGTGVHDSIVNQLLSKIDGVDSLNNVLIIGMTNRKDMIDEALLRPGRLEVHVEIGLPDAHGRSQILKIHTSGMRDNDMLETTISDDIGLGAESTLAKRTKNYSGAEIAGLIRTAQSFTLSRGIDGKKLKPQDLKAFKPKLLMSDLERAIDETKPAFGLNADELSLHFANGIIPYGTSFNNMMTTLRQLVNQVRQSNKTPLLSVLLEAPSGCGKTALAAKIACESGYPFVRMLTADKLIGLSDSSKCNHIFKIFQDAYKSPLSLIIIDDIERCLDYTPIGPRFNNQVLQALLILLKKLPPVEQRKLMIIGTTSVAHMLQDMELTAAFNVTLSVPQLSQPEEIKAVLAEAAPMSGAEMDTIASHISQPIGIKKLLMVTEMARQEDESGSKLTAERFLECLHNTNSL